MTYRHLQLRKLRNKLLHIAPEKDHPSSRRDFLRNMGAGMVVLHPVSKAVSTLGEPPFEIRRQSGHVVVLRKGRVAWEIGGAFFNGAGEVSLHALPDGYRILAHELQVNYTDLRFSLQAEIKNGPQGWTMDLSLPELGIHNRVDFIDWLDGRAGVSGESVQPEHLVRMHAADGFLWQGGCAVYVDAGWHIAVKGDAQIRFRHQGTDYLTDGIILEPATELPEHISVQPAQFLQVTLPSFASWEAFVSAIEFYDENCVIPSNGRPDLRALIGRNNHNHPTAAFWADVENTCLTYKPCNRSTETFTLGSYSYFAEYGGKHSPEFYIGARLNKEDHWISGRLGRMKLRANSRYPDLELFGSGKKITWHLCEPLLESFHPDVAGAVSMPVVFSEPLPLRVNQIHPDAQDPTSVRKPSQVQRNTNTSRAAQVKISFDEIRLEPRRAIRIQILRPEDLVALDFEFHNFVFSNKGQGAFLQLADPKEKGTIIVFFPTQHTLEEAWFETSKIPASGKSESITLPARQLRAQRSRLVYELEAGSTGIPLILEELLDWSRFNLRVHPRAWVRLPALFKPLPFDTPAVTPRNSRPVVHGMEKVRGPLDYQVRQLQQPGIRRPDGFFLKEENIPVLFNTDKTATLSPAFSIAGITRMVLKPAPVPNDCTSLEVPALMYISPNQVNDFSHRNELKLKEFHSEDLKPAA